MARPADPDVRRRLIERAAEMLADREPVTLRSLVDGTGASTMAVYTHFGGMPGLWRAVRQEGFARLSDRLATMARTDDPVHDVAALGVAYAANALAAPALYRAMFDAVAELEDPAVADSGLAAFVAAVSRARDAGRLADDSDPTGVATRMWLAGHGLLALVVQGVLPRDVVPEHSVETAVALLSAAGGDPAACRTSVTRAWQVGPRR